MKSFHIGIATVVVFVIAYFVGVKFPSLGQSALSKVGLS